MPSSAVIVAKESPPASRRTWGLLEDLETADGKRRVLQIEGEWQEMEQVHRKASTSESNALQFLDEGVELDDLLRVFATSESSLFNAADSSLHGA